MRETGRCNFSLGQSWSQLQNGVWLLGSGGTLTCRNSINLCCSTWKPGSDCRPFLLRDFQWQPTLSLREHHESSAGIRLQFPSNVTSRSRDVMAGGKVTTEGQGFLKWNKRNKVSYTHSPSVISGEGWDNKTKTLGPLLVCCGVWGSVSSSVKWGKWGYWEEKILSLF